MDLKLLFVFMTIMLSLCAQGVWADRLSVDNQNYQDHFNITNVSYFKTNGNVCIAGTCIDSWADVNLTTGGISGTTGYIPYFSGSSTIADSTMYYNSSTINVGIRTHTPAYRLDVNGSINTNGNLCIADDCISAWSEVNGSGGGGSNGTVSGSVNYLAYFDGTSSVTNSSIYYNVSSGRVGIGTSVPEHNLAIKGTDSDVAILLKQTISSYIYDSIAGNPSTANDYGGYDAAWTGFGNIGASDNSYVTVVLDDNQESDFLNATGFGIDLPDDANITGIQVIIEGKASSISDISEADIGLLSYGSVVATVTANSTEWGTSDFNYTHGNATSLWGASFTVPQVEDSSFGLRMRVDHDFNGGLTTAYVDTITIRVYYEGQSYDDSWTMGIDYPYENFAIAQGIALSGNRLVIENGTGNIGISVQDPAYRLDVNGSINTNSNLCIGDACIDSWADVNLTTGGVTGTQNHIAFFNSGSTITNTSLYYNLTTGYVGIGMSVLSYALDVNGSINTNANLCIAGACIDAWSDVNLTGGSGGNITDTIWSISGSKYLYNNSGVLSWNETRGNLTYVTPSGTYTLTGKTFDADGSGNSITNIENADIKSGANIDAAKIGTGVISTTEFNYLNGVTSAIQTQIDAKGTLSNVVEDTTPQLGGTLDGNAFNVTVDAGNVYGVEGPTGDSYVVYSGGQMHFYVDGVLRMSI